MRLSVVSAYSIRAILRRYEVAMGTGGLRGAGLLQEIVKIVQYKNDQENFYLFALQNHIHSEGVRVVGNTFRLWSWVKREGLLMHSYSSK